MCLLACSLWPPPVIEDSQYLKESQTALVRLGCATTSCIPQAQPIHVGRTHRGQKLQSHVGVGISERPEWRRAAGTVLEELPDSGFPNSLCYFAGASSVSAIQPGFVEDRLGLLKVTSVPASFGRWQIIEMLAPRREGLKSEI